MKKILLFPILIAVVFGAELSGFAQSSLNTSKTSVESDGCRAALSKARSRIERANYSIVSTNWEKHGYTDYPGNRDLAYVFVLRGQDNIFRSPVFLTSISTDIISNCESVGLVKFAYDRTDGFGSYGLMKNGKVEHFRCDERMPFPLKWGYEWCG